MPVYEFICDDCRHEFEELVFSSSEEVPCPKCTSDHTAKQLSRFAFKSGGTFRSASAGSSSCAGCKPSPGGCGCCSH